MSATSSRPRDFALTLHATPEPASLAVVRHAIGGSAGALGLGPAGVADVRLALTEALTVAIRRAGGSADAPQVEVRAWLEDEALRVAVRDDGHDGARDIPLPLVAAISDAVELTHIPGGGTEVTMTFSLSAPG